MLYVIGLGAYMAMMLAIGFLAKGRVNTAADYLVAGRSLNIVFNSFTLLSCFIGGFLILGVSGAAYSIGIWNQDIAWGVIPGMGGGMMCLVVCDLYYMPKLWRLQLLSLGDFFYIRFGRRTGMLATCLITFGFVFWIAVQILVFGKIAATILGWSLTTAILVAVVVICIYTVLGGLWAVAMTDIVQVSIVLVGVFILLPFALNTVGGWAEFRAATPPELMQVFPKGSSFGVWAAWIAAFLMMGIGGVPSPDIMQRAFAAKTARIARNSGLWAALGVLVVGSVMVVLGQAGAVLVANGTIPEAALNGDPELILPVMFKALLPVPLVVLFLGAAMAAVMSAADSAMLALAGMITKNIYKDVLRPDADDKSLVAVSRYLVVGSGIVATLIALYFPFAYYLSLFAFDLILACLFAPMTLGLYWKKTNGHGALAGMIAGILFRIVGGGIMQGFTLEGILSPMETWYYFTLLSPLISLAATFTVSLATQRTCKPIPLVYPEENGLSEEAQPAMASS